jgi:hypothetical protein
MNTKTKEYNITIQLVSGSNINAMTTCLNDYKKIEHSYKFFLRKGTQQDYNFPIRNENTKESLELMIPFKNIVGMTYSTLN